MKNIISSASKIVFILMAVAACVALFVGKISGEQFMVLVSMAFSFYFANKPTNADGVIIK